MTVSFDATEEEFTLVDDIVIRMETELSAFFQTAYKGQRMPAMMDLVATNANGCPLDFERLLNFPEFDFAHDITGIYRHIDRESGKLENCFLPRCARPVKE